MVLTMSVKKNWLYLAVSLLGLAGGCMKGADDSAFRVTPQKPSPPPAIASHTSGVTGETTPQIAPPPPQSAVTPAGPAGDLAAANSPAALPQPLSGSPPSGGQTSRASPISPVNPTDLPVQLSAAVALPMTGPEGTMMGFSVDYQFRGGTAPGGGSFFWLIEGSNGKQYRVAVKLDARGNLMLVIPGWRPEDGPFRCRLEDQSGRAISATVDMR
jgi:hypothetical protein